MKVTLNKSPVTPALILAIYSIPIVTSALAYTLPFNDILKILFLKVISKPREPPNFTPSVTPATIGIVAICFSPPFCSS